MAENSRPTHISYYEHEAEMARAELNIRRWMIAALISFVALFLSNCGWLIYEYNYQDVVTETITSEAEGGGTAISNRDGSVSYGD